MTLRDEIDRLTPAALRARGGWKWTTYPPDVLPAWLAETDYPVSPRIVAAVRAAPSFGYVPPDRRLGEAFAGWADQVLGWSVEPDHTVPVVDVLAGIERVLQETTRPGDGVVVLTPAYPLFRDVIDTAGRVVVPCGLVDDGAGWSLDLVALEAALCRPDVRSLLLCHPHNPTGRVWRPAELRAIADLVDRHGRTVISDEIHAPLTATGLRFVPYAAAHPAAVEHTVTVVSASKAWGLAGLRTALLIGSPATAPVLRRVPRFERVRGSGLGVTAAMAAWQDDTGWLDEALDYLDANRALLRDWVEATPGVTMREPEGTFLGWLDLRAAGLVGELAEILLRTARVALSAGAEYDAAGFARITYATSRSILAAMLERIGGALRHAQTGRGVSG